jgi:hypothetical protein
MRSSSLGTWLPNLLASAFLGLVVTGCAEELGPEPMRTTSVRGTIHQSNRPISGGWIEFIPADGTVGNQRSAVIGPDGSFSADRVPIGSVAIRLIDVNVVPPFPTSPETARRIFSGFPPPIRRTISENPKPLSIDLLDELIVFQTRRNASASNASGASR